VTMSDADPYDNFNTLPPGGNPPSALGLIYDTLMHASIDEGSTTYGLIAEAASYPEDRSSVTYRLRKGARFHDGSPLTADDVIWSFEKSKDISPFYGQYYKNVIKAERTGDNEVTFRFDVKGNRELPQIVSEFAIFSKAWWTGKDAKGNPRDISKGSTEIPLGSGPYRIKSAEAGKNIVYERVADYWAKDLPSIKGQWNFDTIRFTTYSDPNVEFEAFKAGEVEFRRENSSKRWAQQYDFKGIVSKAAKKEFYPLNIPQGLQGFTFNIRKPQFADRRVREALGLAFDFEWSNKNLFFGQYTRSPSYFTSSEYASSGLPTGRELELLNEVKDKVPAEVFTTEYKNPVNETPEALRDHTRAALALLKDAGWEIKSGNLVNAKTGAPMTLEFLVDSDTFDRVINPYFQNLKRLGINGTIRRVDGAQYVQRVRSFDYDMLLNTFAQSESPGNEQRDFWGSAAADIQGTRNLIGINDAAVDKLIDHIILAKDHADLVAACKALDRVLIWNHFMVPNWHIPAARIAYWDKFRHPEKPPSRDPGFMQVWWYDKDAGPKIDAMKGK
jgi:microcin C transport system substrate-binding protein